ncbi:MAG TPA: histidine kinase [Aggregatilineales bacterium]|nr:histidine kinase [Aggregatilineales bacterium]
MDFARDLIADPKAEIVELVTARMSAIKRKMSEMKAQIDSTQTMVDRQHSRTNDLTTEIQTIKANLDHLPREDIRDKYDETIEARFRLATMQGQLEKFKDQYEYMQTEQSMLSQILTKLQGAGEIEAVEEEEPEGRVNVNVVRIIQAQEEERQRLSRQMHDGPAQSLTNFILQAEICQRLFDRNPARAGEELIKLKNDASITFQKVRDFIFDLRPMMLDDLGVVPTVRRWVEAFKDKNDIHTELEITGEERRLASHREVMIFRSVQELVGHARDYASPSEIKVKLDMGAVAIKVSVFDNGRQFDTQLIYEQDEKSQDARVQGLVSLKERFELINGKMTATSSDSAGTVVGLELPAQD